MFDIFSVPPDAAEATEQMGTKQKFWFSHPELGYCLFKRAREGSGEDWSERVASEIAELLGLPHARYELADWGGRPGVITPSLTNVTETLIHGNELLAEFSRGYPPPGEGPRFRNAEHTVERAVQVIRESGAEPPPNHPLPPRVTTAAQVFSGYLLFDALIGNTDRHHENWGLIALWPRQLASYSFRLSLAPTFDHASCMGRNEPDSTRAARLSTRDRGYTVEAYAERCASAFYRAPSDRKPLSTLEAFRHAVGGEPEAADEWLARLEGIGETSFREVLARVPRERISEVAREFAARILIHNRARLLTDRSEAL